MSKKRPQIHLNVAVLVLFHDDMMYYCNFPLFNEQRKKSVVHSLRFTVTENRVSKHSVISLKFYCVFCLCLIFFLFMSWLGICAEVAVDRI